MIGGDSNFPEYQIKGYGFELLVASDAAESSSAAHSEQVSEAGSHWDDGTGNVRTGNTDW